jgi:hypothetical protein
MPSISAIARDWGTSRPYVSRWVHRRGCPTTSLEAAREWRESCASSRAPTNPKQIARLLEGEEDDSIKTAARRKNFFEDKPHVTRLPSLDSLRDAVDAAIEASETASRLLLEATVEGKESKIAMLLAVHNKAIEMRLKAETHYREELERRGISYSA